MNESCIKHENGSYWVCDDRTQFTVYVAGLTHSRADSSYAHTEDGLSIAIARCNYLARTRPNPNHYAQA